MADLIVATWDSRGNPGFLVMEEGGFAINNLLIGSDFPEINRVLVVISAAGWCG
jgi:hypothetical protein